MTKHNAANCPKCNGRSKIDHMRNGPRGTTRRRTCIDCGHVFFSLEQRNSGPEREDSGISSTALHEVFESMGIQIVDDSHICNRR
jgi:Zn ribbon nucleic-acid-binding protein